MVSTFRHLQCGKEVERRHQSSETVRGVGSVGLQWLPMLLSTESIGNHVHTEEAIIDHKRCFLESTHRLHANPKHDVYMPDHNFNICIRGHSHRFSNHFGLRVHTPGKYRGGAQREPTRLETM